MRILAVAGLAAALSMAGCDDRGNQKLNDANNLIELGKFSDAEKLIQEVITKYPDHAKAYNNLGFCYSNQKQWDKARETYLKALDLYQKNEPDNAEEIANTYDNLALLEDISGHNDAALVAYQKAVAADPTLPRPLHNLATLYRELKQYDKALETFDKALALDPYATPTRTFKALTLLDAGKYQDAAKLYLELLAEDPFKVYFQTQLAFAYLRSGELDKAHQVLQNCLTMNPGSMETQSFVVLLLHQQGKKDDALNLVAKLEKALETPDEKGHKPRLTETLARNIGLAYKDAGQSEAATKWLSQAVKMDGNDHEAEAALAALTGVPAQTAPAPSPGPQG